MPLYDKKLWQKIFKKDKPHKKIDILNDLEAVYDFLKDIKDDSEFLKKEIQKVQELEKESHVAAQGLLQVNLEKQIEVYEQILKRYEFFLADVDINGQRVKILAQKVLNRAHKEGLKDLIWEKKKDPKWRGEW